MNAASILSVLDDLDERTLEMVIVTALRRMPDDSDATCRFRLVQRLLSDLCATGWAEKPWPRQVLAEIASDCERTLLRGDLYGGDAA